MCSSASSCSSPCTPFALSLIDLTFWNLPSFSCCSGGRTRTMLACMKRLEKDSFYRVFPTMFSIEFHLQRRFSIFEQRPRMASSERHLVPSSDAETELNTPHPSPSMQSLALAQSPLPQSPRQQSWPQPTSILQCRVPSHDHRQHTSRSAATSTTKSGEHRACVRTGGSHGRSTIGQQRRLH